MYMNTEPLKWENDEVRVDVMYSVAGVGTSILVASKFTGKFLLLDVGDGALRNLMSHIGTEFVEELDIISITHGHFDHSGGLFSLLGFLRMLKRKTTLDVVFPAGCTEVSGIIDVFKDCYHDSISFQLRTQEVRNRVGFDTDFFKISVCEVEHFGLENTSNKDVLMPAVGYRVRVGDTVVAYTGDTRMCEGVCELVKGADLAIIEATHKEHPENEPRVHLSVKEAEKLGSLAKEFMIVHRIPEIK